MPANLSRPPAALSRPPAAPGSTFAAALAAVARGWYVLPLRPGEKRPLSHDSARCPLTGGCAAGHRTWEQRATRDPDVAEAHWTAHPAHGVGIACGPSGLVVVDLDTPKPGEKPPPAEWAAQGVRTGADTLTVLARRADAEVPRTYTVRTGRGGWHLYYTAPLGIRLANTGRTLGPWVDSRAWGGQVVAAGSTVAGRPYTLARDLPPAPLPPWLFQPLHPASSPPRRPVRVTLPGDRRAAYLAAALARETDRVTGAAEGERNRALYLAATALGQLVAGGALSAADVETMLEQACAGHLAAGAYTIRDAHATITSGLRAGARRPRAVPA